MSHIDLKTPPKREDRLKACIAHGGSICELAGRSGKKSCLQNDGERSFTQGSICLLLPALAMLNSLPDNVVLLHSAVGCGSCSHSQNANVRFGSTVRQGKATDARWLSTAMNETDVITGGEEKLEQAIIEADQRYKPYSITVVSGCVPGIIGDDIDGVIQRLQPEVNARLLPVHCEGFKTKIWATAYDAVYHGIGRTLLRPGEQEAGDNGLAPFKGLERLPRTVNLMNVSSMGRVDELELERLLKELGLDVNVFPVFSHPESMVKATQAALSISTCPTHDDYFLSYLEERFGVPALIQHMPIGIENTGLWLRDVAARFGFETAADGIIAREERELRDALREFRPLFEGKTVFISAGEFRALATARLLEELGFRVVGIRSFHHDEFADVEYRKLAQSTEEDYVVDIANVQPFEEANLLRRLKPDLFLGHANGNGTAAKLGIPTHVIYNTGLAYIGYKGVYELARRLYRQLKNPIYNRNLAENVRLPYRSEWYGANPFAYIASGGTEA
ncbi:nitrogenase component 1 [Geobacter sp. SVR]|uniref:nitrogenase component 1 n=1 Tax=Geobacter sp. SVR TaxID=2495594 RepID=UPI00143F01FA|nr:nitrogenase component 1 [Geobacter sp. SVR]BCS54119.1 nitrogenase [Geobacter sp. SVR]GCF87681.1 oxidoreductase nitrogenase component 1 [Geobacter sp. SVR]